MSQQKHPKKNRQETEKHFFKRATAGRILDDTYRQAVKECKKQVESIIAKSRGKFVDKDFDAKRDFDNVVCDLSGEWPERFALKDITALQKGALQMFVGGVEANDVVQGQWGTCWVLGALMTLAAQPEVFKRMFVRWDIAKSVFGFVFYIDGEWVPIVIDGRLPVNTQDGGTVSSSCRDAKEIWVPLLEKAYAKARGAWENVNGGNEHEALADFTGGIEFLIDLWQAGPAGGADAPRLLQKVRDMLTSGLYLVCGSLGAAGTDKEKVGDTGLVPGHAYAILSVAQLSTGENVVQVRNPWGSGEWTGKFSDRDHSRLGQLQRELAHRPGDDGCFWMQWEDFITYYQYLSVVRIFPPGHRMERLTSQSTEDTSSSWEDALCCEGWVAVRPNGVPELFFAVSEYTVTNTSAAQEETEYTMKGLVIFELDEKQSIEEMEEDTLLRLLRDNRPLVHQHAGIRCVYARIPVQPGKVYLVVPQFSDGDVYYYIRTYWDTSAGEPEILYNMTDLSDDEDEEEEEEHEEEEDEEEYTEEEVEKKPGNRACNKARPGKGGFGHGPKDLPPRAPRIPLAFDFL
eukprot:TRINITY_DN4072_c0_g1_i1.p1 TRINITY_DN4072_c0_g1~~TRINITY_DN4072_c0_g1_i1.p1  ORF type:complete len:584 (+),score=110.85 TRINITY_DN4072_c0_g1_i1:39-1754(+)